MTTVEIVFRYTMPPSDQMTLALASMSDVYGIRRLKFDRTARTLRVEYDATRLSAADVTSLMLQAGLQIVSDPPADPAITPLPVVPPQAPAA